MALGLASVALLPPHPGNLDVAWRMVLCGLGFGFFNTPNNRAIITTAPRSRSGEASGMQATSRLLGQTFGAALVALVFGLFPVNGTIITLVIAACTAAAASAVSLTRLLDRGRAADIQQDRFWPTFARLCRVRAAGAWTPAARDRALSEKASARPAPLLLSGSHSERTPGQSPNGGEHEMRGSFRAMLALALVLCGGLACAAHAQIRRGCVRRHRHAARRHIAPARSPRIMVARIVTVPSADPAWMVVIPPG